MIRESKGVQEEKRFQLTPRVFFGVIWLGAFVLLLIFGAVWGAVTNAGYDLLKTIAGIMGFPSGLIIGYYFKRAPVAESLLEEWSREMIGLIRERMKSR